MQRTASSFNANVRAALSNRVLQEALGGLDSGLVARRRAAVAGVSDFDALRDQGQGIRDRTLDNLAAHLETFERNASAAGSVVHWASTAGEARKIILGICKTAGARLVTKGKSMVSEEIALNAHLEAAGIKTVETDLGEYIVQLRGEMPSHIIAPAIHLTQDDVEADFRRHHTHLAADRAFASAADLVAEARGIMRETFLAADVGITGANFLVAETGSTVIVTNEGNGDLTQTLPRVHIVLATLEKVVPTLADTAVLLRLLARSATGQDMTAYTTFATGPKRPGDLDGPEACHIVLLDNGRTDLLAGRFRDVLRCIRCGACMNHCAVYQAIGGHAYDAVYAGPIGAALTPALAGLDASRDLPQASTFCGRCEDVCPVKIPLVTLMRQWREQEFATGLTPPRQKLGLRIWSYVATRPRLYQAVTRLGIAVLGAKGRTRGYLKYIPFASHWTRTRNLPAPQGRTFQQLWKETEQGVPR
jgi:L-lactate dehydrogenase complex protein LldF